MSKLSNWYYLDRERLKDYDVLKIKKELIESPNSFGLTIADKENMVLYREDSEYFRVPRQYGLDTFGEPDERDLVEGWEIDCNFNGTLDETKHQITLTDQFMSRVPKTVGGILCSGPGCHAKGQGILMHDGTVKNVEDIQVGDQLHGMDYKPRTVYSLCRGRDTMVRIVPVKGKSFVVNINHILTLVRSKNDREYDGEIVDVSVKGWMEWGSRKKSVYKLFRRKAEFSEERTEFSVEVMGEDDYYGFTIDRDGRYLLDDFTVTHNTGKTVMALYLMSQFKMHTLILVNKEFIMQQWFDRIEQFLEGNFTVGKIQQDKCEYTEDIVIGMLQSLNARKYPDRLYSSFGLVVTDETHHISAPTFFDVASRFNPRFMMGLTATPYRGDGLHGVFFKHIGPILAENRTMDVGGLVYQVGVSGKLDDRIFKNRFGKFNISRWISSIAKIKQRTAIIAKHAVKMKKSGRKVMVLTHRLNHVAEIIEGVKELGEEATKTVGGMNAEKVFKAFTDFDIVVGTYQFISEAVDIPELNGMILATPHSNIEQSIGRLTRTNVEKKRPIVTEIVDTWSHRARGYAQKHLRIYDRLGFEVSKK